MNAFPLKLNGNPSAVAVAKKLTTRKTFFPDDSLLLQGCFIYFIILCMCVINLLESVQCMSQSENKMPLAVFDLTPISKGEMNQSRMLL